MLQYNTNNNTVLVKYNSSKIDMNCHIYIHSIYKMNNYPLGITWLMALYYAFYVLYTAGQLVSGLSLFLYSGSTPWFLFNWLTYTYYVQYN